VDVWPNFWPMRLYLFPLGFLLVHAYLTEDWGGKWSNDYWGVPTLSICVDGQHATAGYIYGFAEGEISADNLTFSGIWREPTLLKGFGQFNISLDSQDSFSGWFSYFDSPDDRREWSAIRSPGNPPSATDCYVAYRGTDVTAAGSYFDDSGKALDAWITEQGLAYDSYASFNSGYEEGVAFTGNTVFLRYFDGTGTGISIRRLISRDAMWEFWFADQGAPFHYSNCTFDGADATCGFARYTRRGDREITPAMASINRPADPQTRASMGILVGVVIALGVSLFAVVVALGIVICCYCASCRKANK